MSCHQGYRQDLCSKGVLFVNLIIKIDNFDNTWITIVKFMIFQLIYCQIIWKRFMVDIVKI